MVYNLWSSIFTIDSNYSLDKEQTSYDDYWLL
jgi:hypothetical protein